MVENLFLLNKFCILDILGGFIVLFIDGFLVGFGDVLNFVFVFCVGVIDGDGNVLNCDSISVVFVNGFGVGEVYIG